MDGYSDVKILNLIFSNWTTFTMDGALLSGVNLDDSVRGHGLGEPNNPPNHCPWCIYIALLLFARKAASLWYILWFYSPGGMHLYVLNIYLVNSWPYALELLVLDPGNGPCAFSVVPGTEPSFPAVG